MRPQLWSSYLISWKIMNKYDPCGHNCHHITWYHGKLWINMTHADPCGHNCGRVTSYCDKLWTNMTCNSMQLQLQSRCKHPKNFDILAKITVVNHVLKPFSTTLLIFTLEKSNSWNNPQQWKNHGISAIEKKLKKKKEGEESNLPALVAESSESTRSQRPPLLPFSRIAILARNVHANLNLHRTQINPSLPLQKSKP